MDEMMQLFYKRNMIGKKIANILEEKDLKKEDVCHNAHMSRPTLDRILNGEMNNEDTFKKYIIKLLDTLSLTIDDLIDEIDTDEDLVPTRDFVDLENIAKVTNNSVDILCNIKSNKEISVADMRDIALALRTSTNVVKGQNFFEPQISICETYSDDDQVMNGFWGHVGVCLKNHDQYLWYPITTNVKNSLSRCEEDLQTLVIPCMNNRVLLLNMDHVNELVFLDDACDSPSGMDWKRDVSEGEIPLVVYEVLSQHLFSDLDEEPEEEISKSFKEYLKNIMKVYDWEWDDVYELVSRTTIYYSNGKVRDAFIDFECYENISSMVFDCELFDDMKLLNFEEADGKEICLNWNNVDMLDLPYIELENKIIEDMFIDEIE